jgi:hypothetical protein
VTAPPVPAPAAPVAVAEAVRVALRLGLLHRDVAADPVVLHQGANLVVHLRPAAVVARVAHVTSLVRGDAAAALDLEVRLCRRAHEAGAPVVEPLDAAAGVHRTDAGPLTFWPLVAPVERVHDAAAAGRALADLHAALAGYEGRMPGPEHVAADAHRGAQLLARLGHLPSARAAEISEQNQVALVEMRSLLAELVRHEPGRLVPLHGDPHLGNSVVRGGRVVWWDLDDAWRGPLEWDLMVLHDPVAVAAYADATGVVADERVTAVCRRLREAQAAAWGELYRALESSLRARGSTRRPTAGD